MDIFEFGDFKNCSVSTGEILDNIKSFDDFEKNDFLKFLYSILFFTDFKIDNKVDLQKIIGAYFGYRNRNGNFVTVMEM